MNQLNFNNIKKIEQTQSLWKETQREVRQHWFIYSYISAYIQGLYMYSIRAKNCAITKILAVFYIFAALLDFKINESNFSSFHSYPL
jgi:hypothetical protein